MRAGGIQREPGAPPNEEADPRNCGHRQPDALCRRNPLRHGRRRPARQAKTISSCASETARLWGAGRLVENLPFARALNVSVEVRPEIHTHR